MIHMKDIKPFVKWAGGKTQLLDKLKERVPEKYGTYFEPFVGGGALLLELKPDKAVINDINKELMNTFTQIRDNYENVLFNLKQLDSKHNGEEYYYKKRDEYNLKLENKEYDAYLAALFIYLNKHCYNGLYRVNSKGLFNVPYNKKDNVNSFDEDNIKGLSEYLKNIVIECRDFEESVDVAKKGDFVFFDSPYAPLNPTSFESYTKEGFEQEDHIRLSEVYNKLSNRGVYCILTNHNTEFVRDLYKEFTIETVNTKRMINSKADARTAQEVIITNYEYIARKHKTVKNKKQSNVKKFISRLKKIFKF